MTGFLRVGMTCFPVVLQPRLGVIREQNKRNKCVILAWKTSESAVSRDIPPLFVRHADSLCERRVFTLRLLLIVVSVVDCWFFSGFLSSSYFAEPHGDSEKRWPRQTLTVANVYKYNGGGGGGGSLTRPIFTSTHMFCQS